MDWITASIGLGTGGVIMFVLKKIPNEDICFFVETSFEKLGVLLTLGATKWKITKSIWQQYLEPYLIDLIDNIAGGAIRGLTKGLKSDNK